MECERGTAVVSELPSPLAPGSAPGSIGVAGVGVAGSAGVGGAAGVGVATAAGVGVAGAAGVTGADGVEAAPFQKAFVALTVNV